MADRHPEHGSEPGQLDSTCSEGLFALVGSIQKFSVEDGPGIRTTVFLKGCTLACRWCHNPELISPQQQIIASPNNCIGCGCCIAACPHGAVSANPAGGVRVDVSACDLCMRCTEECYARALRPVGKPMTVKQVLDVAEQDKGFYDNTGGGITISGGEVLAHVPFAMALVDGARERDMNVCLDTCGNGSPQDLMALALRGNVTHVLFDVKSADDAIHRAYTGVGNELVLDNLRMLASDARTRDKVVARMPLIGGVNDGEGLIRRTGELYRELDIRRVDLLPYHDLGVGKARNLGSAQEVFVAPTEERMAWIERHFKEELGLDVQVPGRE